MAKADPPRDRPPEPERNGFDLLLPANPHAVRRALRTAMAALRGMSLGDDLTGRAEIVLAEVLNNVVEHAYADRGRGVVEVEVDRTPGALLFRIRDDGRPLPGSDLPAARAHDLDVADADLPEGGFGWLLIRSLTESLSYRRIGGRNELTFRMPLDGRGIGARERS